MKSLVKHSPEAQGIGLFDFEDDYQGPICGIDEAGRGPLAGPVIAATVWIPPRIRDQDFVVLLNDSKIVSAKKREMLFENITTQCHFGIGQCSADEIDEINIHNATLLAMKRSFYQMREDFGVSEVGTTLVDGKFIPELPCPAKAIVKGDQKSKTISAASIVAKVTRDRLMHHLHKQYPAYQWCNNAGYGTKAHVAAIHENGITPFHRRSFAPIKHLF
jgi:ribonuclease HII